jgi:hypothetical protein
MRDILHPWLKLPPEEQTWIPLEDMQIGNYLCKARNFEVGYWNGERFDYERTKWNCKFDDTEEHWDRGAPHGTVKPLKYLGDIR